MVEGDEADAIVTSPPASVGPAWAAVEVTKDEAAESRPTAVASVARVKGTDLEDRAGIGASARGATPAVPLGTETEGSS